MKIHSSWLLPLLSFFLLLPTSSAGDITRGKTLAQTCVQCHGQIGNAPIANYPKLAGQYEEYLLYAMRAYKSGQRKNLLMPAQISALSDEDLMDLAAYFSAQSGDL